MFKSKRIHPVLLAEGKKLCVGDHIQINDPNDDRHLWEGIYRGTFINHHNEMKVSLELTETGLHCPVDIDKVCKIN